MKTLSEITRSILEKIETRKVKDRHSFEVYYSTNTGLRFIVVEAIITRHDINVYEHQTEKEKALLIDDISNLINKYSSTK